MSAQTPSSLPPLVDLYKAILVSMGCVIEDEMVSFSAPDGNIPITIDNKRLVIPTTDVLRASRWNEWIAFHPICESVVRGESPVLKRTRVIANLRLNTVLTILLQELLGIAADVSRHSQLSPGQLAMLSEIPDASQKTVDALDKVLDAVSSEGSKTLVSIYLKRGGVIDKQKYRRSAIVTFPILEELESETSEVYGVKMSKKDKATLRALFNWIIPKAAVGETSMEYSYGSSSDVAPYFEALIGAFHKVMFRLNAVSWKFRKYLGAYPNIHTPLDWSTALGSFAHYRGHIPVLAGNEGEIVDAPQQAVAVPQPAMPTAAQMVPQVPPLPVPNFTTAQQTTTPPWSAPAVKPIGAATAPQPIGSTNTSDKAVDDGSDWAALVTAKSRVNTPIPLFPAVGAAPMAAFQQPMMQAGYPQQPFQQPMMPGYQQQPMMPGYPQQPQMAGYPYPAYPQQQQFQQPMVFQAVGAPAVPQQPVYQQPAFPVATGRV